MKKIFISFFVYIFSVSVYGIQYDFEDGVVPATINDIQKGTLSVSSDHAKMGTKSLRWDWTATGALFRVNDEVNIPYAIKAFSNRGGLRMWIYSPKAMPGKSLQFIFRNKTVRVYTFDFNLNFTGWRACWIAFSDMWVPGESDDVQPTQQDIDELTIKAPEGVESGTLYFDRWDFSSNINKQATPDAQIPKNNRFLTRDFWHWGRLWEWEQFSYSDELKDLVPTTSELAELREMTTTVQTALFGKVNNTTIANASSKLSAAGIKRDVSTGFISGKPLYTDQEKESGDIGCQDVNDMMLGFAMDYYFNGNSSAAENFMLVFDYALDQGYAYGSGMGTNHHFGYFNRDMPKAVWMMKDYLKSESRWDEALQLIQYWSGLAEPRQPYDINRDELVDTWYTLHLPRLYAALMIEDETERFRAVKGLSEWTNGSICYTPGTIGGIKPDGTAFHHGAHYPDYASSAFGILGDYANYVNGTSFTLDASARAILKQAFMAMASYCNVKEWGIGVCGRHPFNPNECSIKSKNINAFAYLAVDGETVDKDLASNFLRIYETATATTAMNNMKKKFTALGIEKADPMQGFFTYNHAAQGVFRGGEWMVSLKGFNRYVWGAEIYYSNNRYGRYQSYGSIQILDSGDPVTEADSRFLEDGWDWNRLPGTTTIHKSWSALNSPYTDATLKQDETFAGSNNLNGTCGMFVIKLKEPSHKNFTPDFTARKSAFCFDNRIVCIGTGITNSESASNTETTLFQHAILSDDEAVEWNNTVSTDATINTTVQNADGMIFKDQTGNYYQVKEPLKVIVTKGLQTSVNNKTKAATEGKFASAYIDHGAAPSDASYEYLITIQPDDSEIVALKAEGYQPYDLLRKDDKAHIVYDRETGVTGYVFFEETTLDNDDYIVNATGEVMAMIGAPDVDGQVDMSVCDPNLNIETIDYTTSDPSRPVTHAFELKGEWSLVGDNDKVSVMSASTEGNTRLEITCQYGIPVTFRLENEALLANDKTEFRSIRVFGSNGKLCVNSDAARVRIYTLQGRMIEETEKNAGVRYFELPEGCYIVSVETSGGNVRHKVML